MIRTDRWLLYLSNLLVGGSGLVYAWMRYMLKAPDEFSAVNHPWQPYVLHAHVLTAPLLVFAIGHIWYHHAWLYFRSGTRPGRRSGVGLLSLFLPMTASGYLIQISVSEFWRSAWIVLHVAASLLWIIAFVAHLFTHYNARQALLAPGGTIR